MRSALAPYANSMREPDPAAAREKARRAYHESGLILINPAWLNSWDDRKQLEILAEKVHGKRRPI